MKTGARFRILAALAVLVLIQGCDEKNYFITTIVSIEGAIDRMVEWRGVSDSTKWTRLPVPVDSSWHLSYKPATKEDSIGVLTVSKHFASFDELGQEYTRVNDPVKVRVTVNVERRFRWFYTYVDYSETYADPDPLTLIPASEFFTKEEYQRITAGDITDTLHSRIKTWHEQNLGRLISTRLLSAVEQLQDEQLTPSLFSSKMQQVEQVLMGDSIYSGLESDSTFTHLATNAAGKHGEIAAAAAGPAVRALRDIFKIDAVEKLREPYISVTARYLTSQEKLEAIQGHYTNTIVMPGVIIETNAPDISGSRVSWKVNGDQIVVMAVPMHAVSRVVNTWAIVVSALVVTGLMLLPVVLRRRRAIV